MSRLLCYVCSPFEDAALVRAVHDHLEVLGITPTARWIDIAQGVEDFSRYAPSQLRMFASNNDADLRGSDVALVLARHGAGGEMFAEARLAIECGKAVVWCGKRRTLSSWRQGVVRVEELGDAMRVLASMRTQHAEGARGHLLAHLALTTSGAAA